MSRRVLAVLVVVAFALVCAGGLWAKSVDKCDRDRCGKTCTALMKNWTGKCSVTKAHDGDAQCWQTCAARADKKDASPQEAKAIWSKQMVTEMRANKCAQACWRKAHSNKSLVPVVGWRSEPRPSACN
jgi:hypothetical protein